MDRIVVLQGMLKADPTNCFVRYGLAQEFVKLGEFERAINDFNRVISLDRGFADAYNGRGYALYCLGDDPKAIADFEVAIEIDPDDELTRSNLDAAQRRWAERNPAV